VSADGSPLGDRAAGLRSARAPYVHARVVLAERPTSAKPGDEALILSDGTIEGFVGGTCAESTVVAQGLALIDSGESLLLRITPEPEPPQSGKLVVHNACLSGGSLEIFLEPVLPAPRLVVFGDAPVARSVRALASHLGWDVLDPPRDTVDTGSAIGADVSAVVVASHGRDEEVALTAALRAGVPYVGLVASRKRGEAVLASLDADASDVGRVHTPAGLDIGARSSGEVALSIMAEIVSIRPRPSGRALADVTAPSGTATDPVCGMSVATVESSLHLDRDDGRVWFCGTGCLRAFAADPAAYPLTDASPA
jgi:xanthine dehydrogenase accessory factor